MSEGNDYTPVSWGGHHDFKSARKAYDDQAGRSYDDAVAKGVTMNDLLPESLTTDSDAPLSLDCDETGSMGKSPGVIFGKAQYLYHEASTEYLGKNMAISFGAFGDARNSREHYPAQARPFGRGEELKERLKELKIEGDGGGTMHETSELLALYRARNVSMPKAVIKPIHIIITDEMPYDHVTRADAARVHVKIQGKLISTADIFKELKAKYAVYLILMPYNPDGKDDDATNLEILKTWKQYIDGDYIASLSDANRVMDVLLGIMAKETGRIDYFKKEIEDRQEPDQVATVYKALNTIHALPAATKGQKKLPPGGGKSTMFKGKTGKKTDDLA